jgi:hypothetical protein
VLSTTVLFDTFFTDSPLRFEGLPGLFGDDIKDLCPNIWIGLLYELTEAAAVNISQIYVLCSSSLL